MYRWFVDRTGLGIKAARIGKELPKLFPVFDKVALLGDSREAGIELVLPGNRKGKSIRLVLSFFYLYHLPHINRCAVEIPSLGAYTDTQCFSGDRFYTFCVQSERVAVSDTGGAVSRCVVVMPKFLIHNGFDNMELFIRQYKVPGELLTIQPGETVPLHWWDQCPKLLFEFRPGDAFGYAWSVYWYYRISLMSQFSGQVQYPHLKNMQGVITSPYRMA